MLLLLTKNIIHSKPFISQGFAKDRKELILQYLSGLASPSQARDQAVVRNFLSALGSGTATRDPVFYLSIIQKMKGEWYNQEGRTQTVQVPKNVSIHFLVRFKYVSRKLEFGLGRNVNYEDFKW